MDLRDTFCGFGNLLLAGRSLRYQTPFQKHHASHGKARLRKRFRPLHTAFAMSVLKSSEILQNPTNLHVSPSWRGAMATITANLSNDSAVLISKKENVSTSAA